MDDLNLAATTGAVKMWLSQEPRRCRNCNEPIRRALMTDGSRLWLEEDVRPAECGAPNSAAGGPHEPWEEVPVGDPSALAAWLDE